MEQGRLVITVPLSGEAESSLIEAALSILRGLDIAQLPGSALFTLLREQDRSGGNLLLPRLGRNLQGRRAAIGEILSRVDPTTCQPTD